MSGPDRKWRPSDADRERYAGAISQAFAEGRIDATDMESRTALVYEATTIAELDALVEDMPAPATAPVPPARSDTGTGTGAWIRMAFGAVALAVLLGVLLLTFRDDGPTPADVSSDEWSVVDPPEPPPPPEAPPPNLGGEAPPDDLPAIDTVKLDVFTAEGLQEMWDAMAAAGHTDLYSISLFKGDATVEAAANTTRPALVRIEYEGGLVLPPTPYRDATPGEAPFRWTDVAPAAVLAAIDAMPGITGAVDVTVGHISITNDADDGVTINVYPEGDTGITYAKFEATGTRVLNVY